MLRGVAIALTVLSVGCVKVHVASQDFQTGVVTICGNKHATQYDLNEKAAEVCTQPPTILRCAEQVYGTQTVTTANAYATSPTSTAEYGTSTTKKLTGNCCEYQCPPTPQPPAAR